MEAARLQVESTATAAATTAKPANRQIQLIQKPHSSAGDGYCLIEEMGLIDDKLTYNAIVVSAQPFFSITLLPILRPLYMNYVMALASSGSAHTCTRVKKS